MLRLAIIEDDRRYRSSLEELFAGSQEFELVGSFSSPPRALAQARRAAAAGERFPWDLVLMDIEMPEMNGIEATRRLKEIAPSVKVVLLTVFEQPETILQAICAGGDGYLLKKSRVPELLQAVRHVVEGGAPLTPLIARSVLDLMRTLTPASASLPAPTRLDLTEREQEVLRALVDGLSYKQVAETLGIGLGTVRGHVLSVYRKLQVHTVAEAVSRALRERLV